MRYVLSMAMLLVACSGRDEAQVKALEARMEGLEEKMDELEAELDETDAKLAMLLQEKKSGSHLPARYPMSPSGSAKKPEARCDERDGVFLLDAEEAKEFEEIGDSWMTWSRMIPYVKGGETIGVKIYGLKLDTFLASCGLYNGDVVLEVNGVALTQLDAVQEAIDTASEDGEGRLRVQRKGKEVEVKIVVEDYGK